MQELLPRLTASTGAGTAGTASTRQGPAEPSLRPGAPEALALLHFQHGALISPSFGTEIRGRGESGRWQLPRAQPWMRVQGRERVLLLAGGHVGMLQAAPELPWPPVGPIPGGHLP